MLPTCLMRTTERFQNTGATGQQRQFLWRLVVMVALALSLSACGFHLRGNIPLSDGLKNMYLNAPSGRFKDLMEDRLLKLGANLSASPKEADVILDIVKFDTNRTVGTLDGRGKVNSFNIILTVRYKLLDANGKPIRPRSSVRELRRYDFDPEDVIASEAEEEDLLEDMEKEAVLKIMRQLAAITDFDPNETRSKKN